MKKQIVSIGLAAILCAAVFMGASFPVSAEPAPEDVCVEIGSEGAAAYQDYCKPKVRYEASSNIQQAEEYAENTLGIFRVAYQGIDLELANIINEELTQAYNKYPDAMENLSYVGSSTKHLPYLKDGLEHMAAYRFAEETINDSGYTFAQAREYAGLFSAFCNDKIEQQDGFWKESYLAASCGGNGDIYGYSNYIVFNSSTAQDYLKLDSIIRSSYQSGHFVTEDFHGIVQHEIGHFLAMETNFMNSETCREIYSPLSEKQIKAQVSGYAATNMSEFTAECWADYQEHKEPKKISMQLGGSLERFYSTWEKDYRVWEISNGQIYQRPDGSFYNAVESYL